MFALENKHATMGLINLRTEKHGEDSVTAFDIPLDMLLDQAELEQLVAHVAGMLFNDKRGVLEPAFPQFESFALKDAIEAKQATISIGAGSKPYEIEFEDVRLKALVLTPILGGSTQLTLKLQVRPESKHLAKLIDSMETSIQFSVSEGKFTPKNKRQQDLPLGEPKAEDKPVKRKTKNGAGASAH